jgi:hypothetical protein
MTSNRDLPDLDLTMLRPVNGYWCWRDKPVAERGAAKAILEACGFSFERLVSRLEGQDPPDCEAMIGGMRAASRLRNWCTKRVLNCRASRRRLAGDGTTWWFAWDQRLSLMPSKDLSRKKRTGRDGR